MNAVDHIRRYLESLAEPKQSEMRELHHMILDNAPGCSLQFFDGRDDTGKVVSNPTIGYGSFTQTYADGSTRASFRIGLSANTAGISVYILGLNDKSFLATTYGADIGKATVTGYCIKFRSLKNINASVLMAAVRYGCSLTD